MTQCALSRDDILHWGRLFVKVYSRLHVLPQYLKVSTRAQIQFFNI